MSNWQFYSTERNASLPIEGFNKTIHGKRFHVIFCFPKEDRHLVSKPIEASQAFLHIKNVFLWRKASIDTTSDSEMESLDSVLWNMHAGIDIESKCFYTLVTEGQNKTIYMKELCIKRINKVA